MLDAEGRPTKLLGTSRDMTEYRTLQEELAQTSKLATLGTLAAGIAHEMSQPLNIIRITADDNRLLMEEDGMEADAAYLRQGMELISTQAARMGEIVDQMRSFSRRDGPEVVPFDPVQPVRRAVALLDRHFATEGTVLALSTPPTASAVAGRPGRLEQVVINLLSNAHDAIVARRGIDPGFEGGLIEVGLSEEQGPHQIRITISDDGTGLPPGMADRIFDPFVTTKEATKGSVSACRSAPA